LAQLFKPLLMRHAEAVLLVDNHQAEVFKLHVLLQQAVRADDDINRALAQAVQDLLDFLGREKTADHLDAHRMIAKTAAEGLQVLLRQDRRRRQ